MYNLSIIILIWEANIVFCNGHIHLTFNQPWFFFFFYYTCIFLDCCCWICFAPCVHYTPTLGDQFMSIRANLWSQPACIYWKHFKTSSLYVHCCCLVIHLIHSILDWRVCQTLLFWRMLPSSFFSSFFRSLSSIYINYPTHHTHTQTHYHLIP